MTSVLEGSTGFIIFFDDQHIEDFVMNFNVDSSLGNPISTASIQVIYTEAFMKIEYLTDVKIFIKNPFSGRYKMVFDGQLHNRQVSISPDSRSIVFTAYDNMFWLQRMPVPLLFGVEENIDNLVMLTWLARGVNYDQVKSIITAGQQAITGKNLKDLLTDIFAKINNATAIHDKETKPDENTIYTWLKLSQKVKVVSDIDPNLRDNSLVDMFYQGAIMENMYVFLSGIISKLGYEMYQDHDGLIKIKEPFWDEALLKPFIIDPIMLINMSENTNWDNKVTRVLVTGGIESAFQRQLTNDFSVHQWTPAGVYVGNTTNDFFVSSNQAFLPDTRPSGTNYVKQNTFNTSTASRDAIVSKAWEALGTPYASGGNSPYDKTNDGAGIDCSGLVFYAFNQAGYRINDMTADSMYKYASPIDIDAVQPGDLGFSINGGKATHVGIYCGVDEEGYHTWIEAAGHEKGVTTRRSKTNKAQGWHKFGDLVTAVGGGYAAVGTVAVPMGEKQKALTKLTDVERKYGINLLETSQPLIRVGIYTNQTHQNQAYTMLQDYSKYLFNMTNAAATSASMTLIPSPWLRLGFNLWFDPEGLSRVYYINSIRHSGDANGVYTSLGLIYGRSEAEFTAQYAAKKAHSHPMTVTSRSTSYDYFFDPSGAQGKPLDVVKPSDMKTWKAEMAKVRASCDGNGSFEASTSPYNAWYGRPFIRRNKDFLNRWDSEFNLLEIYSILAAQYGIHAVATADWYKKAPQEGDANPLLIRDRVISSFAREAVAYDSGQAGTNGKNVPTVIKTRAQTTSDAIQAAYNEIKYRYVQSNPNDPNPTVFRGGTR